MNRWIQPVGLRADTELYFINVNQMQVLMVLEGKLLV